MTVETLPLPKPIEALVTLGIIKSASWHERKPEYSIDVGFSLYGGCMSFTLNSVKYFDLINETAQKCGWSIDLAADGRPHGVKWDEDDPGTVFFEIEN